MRKAESSKRAVFFDRDGVVCEAMPRGEYLVSWDQFKLTEGITELVDFIRGKGYLAIVITNQGQIAKGLLSEGNLVDIHRRMMELLPGRFDKIYYCPHHDADNCDCRKPKPGMLLKAAKELNVDLSQSYVIGDSDKDVNAGKAAGCKTIFLKNSYNAGELARCSPDFIVTDLKEIKALIQ